MSQLHAYSALDTQQALPASVGGGHGPGTGGLVSRPGGDSESASSPGRGQPWCNVMAEIAGDHSVGAEAPSSIRVEPSPPSSIRVELSPSSSPLLPSSSAPCCRAGVGEGDLTRTRAGCPPERVARGLAGGEGRGARVVVGGRVEEAERGRCERMQEGEGQVGGG